MDQTKPKCTVTIDDLLADLKPDDAPGGLTIRELCEMSGFVPVKANMSKVQRKVSDLIALGSWEFAGKPMKPSVTGKFLPTPAYRPKGGGQANQE